MKRESGEDEGKLRYGNQNVQLGKAKILANERKIKKSTVQSLNDGSKKEKKRNKTTKTTDNATILKNTFKAQHSLVPEIS